MIKILIIVIVLHVLSFSVIWVGFPIQQSNDKELFFYSQLQMPLTANELMKEDAMPIKVQVQADQDLWNIHRLINKPRR